MTVLVTGGTGFIGQALIAALVAQGRNVRATARTEAGMDRLAALGATPHLWTMESPVPEGLCARAGQVYHLACPRRIADAASGSTHRPSSEVLIAGTARLAEAMVASGAGRMVLASSAAVYGKIWGSVAETAVPAPDTLYGAARLGAEGAARTAFAATPGRLVIPRLSETFGPGDSTHRSLLLAIAQRRFRLIGDGRALHQLSPVDDVVAALIRCGEMPDAAGAVMNIGGPAHAFRQFLDAVASACGTRLRTTPLLQHPATAMLLAMRAAPRLAQARPRVFAALDYQIRPRAIQTGLSERRLGRYARADMAQTVTASVAAVLADRAAPGVPSVDAGGGATAVRPEAGRFP